MLKAPCTTWFFVLLACASVLGCSSSTGSATATDSGGKGGESAGSGGSGGSDAALDLTSIDLPPDSPGSTAPDTGTADPAEAGSSAGCANAAYKLCDDFEGVAPGAAGSPWTVIKKGTYTLELDTTQAHSGTHSVHATATAPAGYAFIQETKTFPATDFWVRAYLRLEAPAGKHEVYVGADTNIDEGMGDQVRFLNKFGTDAIATNRRAGDRTVRSATLIPTGSWDCYEWHETPDGVHVYFKGQALPDADWIGAQPVFVALVFGIERFDPGTPGEIWIDDVVVSSTQIGCN
jgi:hypothetical protein